MHIVGLIAEDYKGLRVVEITPKGRMVEITGKNGQGKTSVLDAIWTLLKGKGKGGIPDKPVRAGASKSKLTLKLGNPKTGTVDCIVTRVIGADRTMLKFEVNKPDGTRYTHGNAITPQAVLDLLMDHLTFDPLEFVRMSATERIAMLHQVAKIEEDLDALREQIKADYSTRTQLNNEVKRLDSEAATITLQADLPKDKINEVAISQRLAEAGTRNAELAATIREKDRLRSACEAAEAAAKSAGAAVEELAVTIAQLERKLAEARSNLITRTNALEGLTAQAKASRAAYDAAPEGKLVDTTAILNELEQARITNREITKKERKDGILAQRDQKAREADRLTRAMADTEERIRVAVATAKLPVEGLTFDEKNVYVAGVPLEQLGEAEQIRLSTQLAMAANPKIRVLRIMHGEALDEDGMQVLTQMAEENDFQIWMARVDSSGKVGVVMQDGMVAADHQGEEAQG